MIYCKFWELDTDHDFVIDKDDLLRYGNHALTYRIVERIFSEVVGVFLCCLYQIELFEMWSNCFQIPRKFTCPSKGKMGYEDFVWFILSEEDKTTEPSLEYW